jgi:hypothetical protein
MPASAEHLRWPPSRCSQATGSPVELGCAERLSLPSIRRNIHGRPRYTSVVSATSDLMLSSGEAVVYTVTGCSLVEDRRGRGHYEGHSSGACPVPVGKIGGRPGRYRVGASKGHYVHGSPRRLRSIPVPRTSPTSDWCSRAAKQTRECTFANLIGFRHDDRDGSTTISVSNRQNATTIHYGPKLAGNFRLPPRSCAGQLQGHRWSARRSNPG